MNRNKFVILLGSLFTVLILAAVVHSDILGNYAGYTACEICHPEIVKSWEATPHAKAFEGLKAQGEEKQENPECLQCHVVAYGKDGGFIDMDLTPELKDVQCESCHGPSKPHAETLTMEGLIKPTEEVCRTCHTEEQDENFDYAAKSKLVHPVK